MGLTYIVAEIDARVLGAADHGAILWTRSNVEQSLQAVHVFDSFFDLVLVGVAV